MAQELPPAAWHASQFRASDQIRGRRVAAISLLLECNRPAGMPPKILVGSRHSIASHFLVAEYS